MATLGTRVGSNYGFVRTPTTLATTDPATTLLYTAEAVYTQSWYQPKYKTSYAATELRRYNGSSGTGESFTRSKVKGYCMGIKEIES